MKNKIIFILCIILTNIGLYSQEIKILRTDVDSSRSNFVTATYSFEMDIIVQNVTRCNLVTFELTYTNSDYINYSEYSILNFGDSASAQVISQVDNLTKTGTISAAVYSGDTIGAAGYDNPKVIHFEFIVTGSSIHGTEVNFTFSNARAVVTDTNNTGKIISLKSDVTTYRINSFIKVWPGDADNSGLVDNLDFAQIGLFLQSDSAKQLWRSFKRVNSSTLWYAQKVLAWDTISAAYADCDGNGEVTIDDMGVVYINFDSVHIVSLMAPKHGNNQYSNTQNYFYYDNNYEINKIYGNKTNSNRLLSNTKLIPVYISPQYQLLAATGSIKFSKDNFNITGIENGNLFPQNDLFIFFNKKENENTIEFSIGSLNKQEINSSGVLIYLKVEDNPSSLNQSYPESININGWTATGDKFSMSSATDVNENLNIVNINELNISQNKDELNIQSSNNVLIKNINIYDVRGNLILNELNSSMSNNKIMHLANIAQGTYIIFVETDRKVYSKLINIIK